MMTMTCLVSARRRRSQPSAIPSAGDSSVRLVKRPILPPWIQQSRWDLDGADCVRERHHLITGVRAADRFVKGGGRWRVRPCSRGTWSLLDVATAATTARPCRARAPGTTV